MIPVKKEALLVSPRDIKPISPKFSVIGTFNPAAARLPNGDIALYVRVAEKLKNEASEDSKYYYAPRCEGDKTCRIKLDKFRKDLVRLKSPDDIIFKDDTKRLLFISHFRRVILDKTGFKIKSIDKKPSFSGLKANGELGVEDPRIVKIGDKYIMTYVSLSRLGDISTSLATSKDCINWDRKGMIFSEQNKDVVLFPEKSDKFYYAFNRPESEFQFSPPHMWISSSKDLINWGHNRPLLLSKKGNWDYQRVGAGAPPIKTKKGWLLLYHGVVEAKDSLSYEVGAALFDLKSPRKLIAKSPQPILSPVKNYAKTSSGNNIIFPTGLISDENGEDLLLFSGEADTVTTVKKISLQDIFKAMKK
ncbi:MAG TPA: hypothetical protein VMC07_01930 [Candidatus Omnitrophota bacterium]|nr:hypothetical protein [Candidatus Omnitrophota bacterium]